MYSTAPIGLLFTETKQPEGLDQPLEQGHSRNMSNAKANIESIDSDFIDPDFGDIDLEYGDYLGPLDQYGVDPQEDYEGPDFQDYADDGTIIDYVDFLAGIQK